MTTSVPVTTRIYTLLAPKPVLSLMPPSLLLSNPTMERRSSKLLFTQAMMEHCDAASDSDGETLHANICSVPSYTEEPIESSPPAVDNEDEPSGDADLEALCAIGFDRLIKY
jgi:hypothetical protein